MALTSTLPSGGRTRFTASVLTRLMTGSVVLLVAFGTAGCRAGDPPGAGGSGGAGGSSGACRQAGPLTRDLLPTFGAAETTTKQNPCFGFADLVSQATGLIPVGDRSSVDDFIRGVDTLVKRVAALADVVQCGYETDRLAIAIYQNHATLWSVGVVAVVRGDLGAALDTSVCFLRKQLSPPGSDASYVSGPAGPQPTFCFDAVSRTRGGERYTVMWVGSSDFMCWDLTNQLDSGRPEGDGITSTVKAVPDVAVRSGPSTRTALVGRADTGEVGEVSCYRRGETVSGRRGTSDLWDLTTVNGMTGFIADVWLDTGGDVTKKIKPCPPT